MQISLQMFRLEAYSPLRFRCKNDKKEFTYSRTPLFRTRLIRSLEKSPLFRRKIKFPWIYPYVFSHLLSAISNSVITNSRYFELIVLSLHLKSTPLFRTCQKQSAHIRAQLETYCILFELVLRN